MRYSATRLRRNLYHILDMVIDEGGSSRDREKGHILKIIAETPLSKWDRLEPHRILKDDPESIVTMDLSEYWSGGEDV